MPNNPGDEKIHLTPRIRYRSVGKEGVLVHLDNGRVIVVNEVGLHVIQRLDTPMTRQDLAASIVGEFETSKDQAIKDLDAFLSELDAEQAIERKI